MASFAKPIVGHQGSFDYFSSSSLNFKSISYSSSVDFTVHSFDIVD